MSNLCSPTLDDRRWLIENASNLLSGIPQGPLSVKFVADLRRRFSPIQTHLLLEQIELRRRGREKFEQCDAMFFTDRGLQQSSAESIAKYKAERFARDAPVVDLCCGIGGDLLALAARGPVVGVDRDPAMAMYASANLRLRGNGNARVVCADISQVDLSQFAAWHVDPDRRRPDGRRRSHPEFCEPPVSQLLRRSDLSAHGAIKMAPAAEVNFDWVADAELEWIGNRGQCSQLVAWMGDLASDHGRRVATLLQSKGESTAIRRIVGQAGVGVDVSEVVESFVFEPHPAVLAAGLEEELARAYGLSRLSSEAAYLTADHSVENEEALTGFQVLEVFGYRRKRAAQLLRKYDAGHLEVKKRGVDVDPAELQRQLSGKGTNQLTLLLFPVRRAITAVLARRLQAAPE